MLWYFILVFRNIFVVVKIKQFTFYIPLRSKSEGMISRFQFLCRRIRLFYVCKISFHDIVKFYVHQSVMVRSAATIIQVVNLT